jgi:hypothetical protein
MANKTLKALTNTVIKSLPQDSISLSDSQKITLPENATLEILQYRSAPNNHWEIQLLTPQNGIVTWFAFISHVEIFSDPNFKKNLVEIATGEWDFFEKGKGQETTNGFWQRVVRYWKEGVNIHHIDTPDEVGDGIKNPWSAAFISWIMKEAGAADKFKRDASHSVYIHDAVQKRKNRVVNAPFVAFKVDEVTPEVGDLVCAPRASSADFVKYDTPPHYASHCDLVVAKRPNEIDMIGGNVNNSVSKTTIELNTEGKVIPNGKILVNGNPATKRPWFVVIKNLL